jgi:hypothetical protein
MVIYRKRLKNEEKGKIFDRLPLPKLRRGV